MTTTFDKALKSFHQAWRSGETSRRYFGQTADSKPKSMWIARDTRDAIRTMAQADGVAHTTIVQEALRWYCEQMGRPVSLHFPRPQDLPVHQDA